MKLSLEAAAKTLNAETDKLAPTVEQINLALKRLNLGFEAWSAWHPLKASQGTYEIRLGYGLASKWGLLVGRRPTVDPKVAEPEDMEPEEWAFMEAPRATRIEAIFYLDELLVSLEDAATQGITQVLSACKFAEAFVEKMKT